MEWHEIKTDEDVRMLNELYGYFEDSFIISMQYISGDYVDSELFGHMEQENDLRVVFQRLDNDPFSVELWFTHTKRISNFVFVNPGDNMLSDIMRAKVCKNEDSVYWTVWEDFDPYDNEHLSATDIKLIEAEGLKWRIAAHTANI